MFDDYREGIPGVHKTIDGLSILPYEVRAATKKMGNNKALGPDRITTEMIKAIDDFSIEKFTNLANEMCEDGKIPEDLCRSIFIMIPKRPGTTEFELHRTISLISHIIKLILMVIMARIRKCTRNENFLIRPLSEKAIEKQTDLYICFLDYTKAFNRVIHGKIIKLLQRLDTDGKDIQLMRSLN